MRDYKSRVGMLKCWIIESRWNVKMRDYKTRVKMRDYKTRVGML